MKFLGLARTTGQPRRLRALTQRTAGELAVIVLGVTVALWGDGWVAKRNDRAKEAVRVRALLEDVEATLDGVRRGRIEADSAAAALRRLASPQSPMREAETESALLVGFFYVPVFHPELSVYDDLKNSGELSLLRDGALRRALSTLDGHLQQLGLYQQDMATVQQLNFDPYLINRIDLRKILGGYLKLDSLATSQGTDLSFISELAFRNLVLFKLDLADQMVQQFAQVETTLLAVQQLITAQLERVR